MTTYNIPYLLTISLLSIFLTSCDESTRGRQELRKGNKKYESSLYDKAQSSYMKSVESEKSLEAYYGIGNSIQRQSLSYPSDKQSEMDSTAESSYQNSLSVDLPNRLKRSKVYHNQGNLYYLGGLRYKNLQQLSESNKKFESAIESYKSSLINNPNDDETRYNLAMAMYMLEKNRQEQQEQDNNQQNQDNKDDQENKDNKDQQNKDNQNQDNKENQDQENKEKKDQQDKQNQDRQDKQDEDKQQNKNTQPNQPEQSQMDREKAKIDEKTANQLLNAAQQDENKVQKKLEKATVGEGRYEKDW